MQRIPEILTTAALTALALFSTGGVATAQSSGNSTAERRLVLPAGQTAGLDGRYWRSALANGGRLPAHERLLVVASDGRVMDVVDGEGSRVLLPADLHAALVEGAVRATLVHNHPASVSLSPADLLQLSKPGVERVIVVGNDGSVFEASAAARYDRGRLTEDVYATALTRVIDRLSAEARVERLNLSAMMPHVPHLLSSVLFRLGMIDYHVAPSLQLMMELDRYRDFFAEVVRSEAETLEKSLR